MGRKECAMTEKTEKIEHPRKGKELPLPQRPSYERALENIDRWANSPGLQKPK
jgi:hypothetical protein